MPVHFRVGLAALGLVSALTAETALADPHGDHTYQPLRSQRTFFIQRYPGDQAIAGGTVRMQGPDKGPYVERCFWTMNDSFYGLPLGLTQRCYRYTLENTPAQ